VKGCGLVEIIREDKVAPAFRRAMKNDATAAIAVPFWGKGAIELLGLHRGQKLQIVCNIDHPGCNPHEIEAIRKLGLKVWTHPRLHAKLYVTKTIAIIGSSNVSSNGLAMEGRAARGWIEGNVIGSEAAFVSGARGLFDTILGDAETRSVRKADIELAKERRSTLPPSLFEMVREGSLLQAARAAPEAFGNVFLALYQEQLDAEAKVVLKTAQADGASKVGADKLSNLWGYQFPDMPRGAWLIDISCIDRDHPRYHFTARVIGDPIKIPRSPGRRKVNDLSLALRERIQIGPKRFVVTAAEKVALVAVARRLCAFGEDGLVKLTDALKQMDA
jgi:hypothetical protein